MSVDPATVAWIALWIGVAATVGCAWMTWRSWRAWQQLSRTRQAATALLDAHRTQLDDLLQETTERSGAMAEGSEQLAAAIGELRADVSHLQWLLDRIPSERERLGRELLNYVLPTRRARKDRADG